MPARPAACRVSVSETTCLPSIEPELIRVQGLITTRYPLHSTEHARIAGMLDEHIGGDAVVTPPGIADDGGSAEPERIVPVGPPEGRVLDDLPQALPRAATAAFGYLERAVRLGKVARLTLSQPVGLEIITIRHGERRIGRGHGIALGIALVLARRGGQAVDGVRLEGDFELTTLGLQPADLAEVILRRTAPDVNGACGKSAAHAELHRLRLVRGNGLHDGAVIGPVVQRNVAAARGKQRARGVDIAPSRLDELRRVCDDPDR